MPLYGYRLHGARAGKTFPSTSRARPHEYQHTLNTNTMSIIAHCSVRSASVAIHTSDFDPPHGM
jgi:hypothetical protein